MNIKYGRKIKQIPQNELAKLLKISVRTVINWEQGISKPDAQALIDMARIFDFSLDDFLLKNIEAQGVSIGAGSVRDAWVLQKNQNLLIPKEGFEKYINDEYRVGVDFYYIYNPILNDDGVAYRTFEVSDDTMAPLLLNGDWVGCCEPGREHDPNRLHAVVLYSGKIVLRYVHFYDKGVKLIPANHLYVPELIDVEGIKEFWEVKCRITKYFQVPYRSSEIEISNWNDYAAKDAYKRK